MGRSLSGYVRIAIAFAVLTISALAAELIPNSGQQITPTAPAGARFESLNPGLADNSQYLAGQAVTTVVSPDGKTLLVLTSGYNLLDSSAGKSLPADSTQFVFVYDISNNTPEKKQVIHVANTYSGIVFDPSGKAFYVSGGVDDDVHAYSLAKNATWPRLPKGQIALGNGGTESGIPSSLKPRVLPSPRTERSW